MGQHAAKAYSDLQSHDNLHATASTMWILAANNDSGLFCLSTVLQIFKAKSLHYRSWNNDWPTFFCSIQGNICCFFSIQCWQSTPNLKLQLRWEKSLIRATLLSVLMNTFLVCTKNVSTSCLTFLHNHDEVLKVAPAFIITVVCQLVMPPSDFRGPRSLAVCSVSYNQPAQERNTWDQQDWQVHYYLFSVLYYYYVEVWHDYMSLRMSDRHFKFVTIVAPTLCSVSSLNVMFVCLNASERS